MSALADRATRHCPPPSRRSWPRSEPQPPLRSTRRRPTDSQRRQPEVRTRQSAAARPRTSPTPWKQRRAGSAEGRVRLGARSVVLRCQTVVGGGSYGRVPVVAREDGPPRRPWSAALTTAANASHRARSRAPPLLRTWETASDGTVLLCRSGSRSPAAVAALLIHKPLRSFVAAGQGSLTISILAPMLATFAGVRSMLATSVVVRDGRHGDVPARRRDPARRPRVSPGVRGESDWRRAGRCSRAATT